MVKEPTTQASLVNLTDSAKIEKALQATAVAAATAVAMPISRILKMESQQLSACKRKIRNQQRDPQKPYCQLLGIHALTQRPAIPITLANRSRDASPPGGAAACSKLRSSRPAPDPIAYSSPKWTGESLYLSWLQRMPHNLKKGRCRISRKNRWHRSRMSIPAEVSQSKFFSAEGLQWAINGYFAKAVFQLKRALNLPNNFLTNKF